VAKLPVMSGKEAVRVFEKAGWEVARRRSSHIVMVRAGSRASLSVPDHRELDRGTLRTLIRLAGLTVGQFVKLLREK